MEKKLILIPNLRCSRTIAYSFLFIQVCFVATTMSETMYTADYTDADYYNPNQNGISNYISDNIHPFDTLEKQLSDGITQKRHLGAVARLSGTKQRNEANLGTGASPPKRHVGAFAALSGIKYPSPPALKRHLGSVASKQGFRSPVPISASRISEADYFGMEKKHMGALAKTSPKNFNRVGKSLYTQDFSSEDDAFAPADEHFYDYPADMQRFPAQAETSGEGNGDFADTPLPTKPKRFLGSLARVGWFPRQFRGIVAENPYEKRHIGSAARVGWLPYSKLDRSDDGFGESNGFKRNIQSLRKSNYALQNQWERPQRVKVLM